MDVSGSYCGKRSFADLDCADQQKSEDEEIPKKKLRTKLVDLFNRASICMTSQPEGHMKVYLRIKPFSKQEDNSQKCFVVAAEENTIEATAPVISHTFKNMKRGLAKSSHKFTFSKIFGEDTTQAKFFNETMLSMTKDFISGQNSLVFTYGVTSSGKTYTIQGMPQDAGILPRCLDVIFNSISGKQTSTLTFKPLMFTDVSRLTPEEVMAEKKVKARTMRMSVNDDTTVMTLLGDEMESVLSDSTSSSTLGCAENLLKDVENRAREQLKVEVEDQGKILFCVWVSFAEIYNEQIYDLLEPLPTKKNAKRPSLRICDDRNGNPYVKGLKEIQVDSADEAYRLLTIGQRNLQTACTRLNHCSSRSHCIFNIKIVRIVDDVPRVSMLSLCDLAGSERYSKTQATGDRLKEAGNINASLMTLGRCIETLRHNQLHKDQQRLVPFRDSKLTRLLQNFFNGYGRASMIVNVSQCMSMFDDTLQVFKFSAIAKQVKYIEPPKPIKDKKILPMPRGSIAWESQESSEKVLLEAQDDPLPDDDDEEDDSDDGSSENKDTGKQSVKEMQQYIKALEHRNERLAEMLNEEMNLAGDLEYSIRKEVTDIMIKQLDDLRETYNALLKETREETNDIADERVKGIMEVYEQRIQRIQRKVDEDDEWVSSMLYFQEQCKVEELKATVADLQKELADLKDSKNSIAEDSTSLGDSVLIETLTKKLQEATEACKLKDSKMEELESLLAEAGEVYVKHVAEITSLKETTKIQKDQIENQFSTIKVLQVQLHDSKTASEELKTSFQLKGTEMKALEEDLLKKIKIKDSTISSLEEECKELQDEIERLQDQMSQIDEHSKYRCDLESSAFSEKSHSHASMEPLKSGDITAPKDATKTAIQDSYKEVQEKTKLLAKLSLLEENVKQNEIKIELLEKSNNDLETMQCVKSEMEGKIQILQLENEQLTSEMKNSTDCLKQTQVDLQEAKKVIAQYEEELNTLKKEIILLKAANENFKSNMNSMPKQLHQSLTKSKSPTVQLNITDLVRQLEKKKANGSEPNTNDMEEDGERDSEVEFNFKHEPTPSVSENFQSVDLSLKLKNSELANAALRSKLKKEEEDFFKREQALIHGYTAEIEGLKYELAKMKSKVDTSSKARPQRNKRKLPGLDVSVCSVTSESMCDGAEGSSVSRTLSLDVPAKDKQQVEVLLSEISSLQAELLSLNAAYRKLHVQNVNETNTFIHDVVLGTQTKRPSILGVFRSEDNVTDSVLQFEIEEYAIKMDELRTKITQLENELDVCKEELKNEKNSKKDIEVNLEQQLKDKDALINKIIKEKEELKDSLIKEFNLLKENEEKNLEKEEKFHLDQLQEQLTSKESHINEILLEKEELQNSLVKEKNLKTEKEGQLVQLEQQLTSKETLINEILLEKEELKDLLVRERDLKKETEVHLTQLETQLTSKETLLHEMTQGKAKTEKELEEMNKIVNTCRQQLQNAEEMSKESREKLQHLIASRDELLKELSEVRVKLASKEESIKQLDTQCSSLLEQQKEYYSDGDSKSKAITELQNELIALKHQKEKMESQHQEAAAEFSQKLLMVEREKKLIERKAKEREEEWEMKCLGHEKMKQDNKVEELQKKTEELLQALESEKEEKAKLQKTYSEQLCELKNGLNYSEETIVSYENLLQTQDNDILDLKKEIESLYSENKKLEQVIGSKELEVVHINKQLEEKVHAIRQIEKKAMEVEHKEKCSYEQIQKTIEERGALEESLQKLKDKNRSLKNKYENLENLMKREKQDLNDIKDRLKEAEKSKSELEMKITEDNHSYQQELAKAVKERATAQESSSFFEKQLNIIKEETSKNTFINTKHDQQMEDLENSNIQLKEEINKLKQDLKCKEKEYNSLQKTVDDALESKKGLEKEIQKQERLNKRNREEMENWKHEKDSCVGQLEQLISKRQQENRVLVQENELIKRENAELTKKITSVTHMKDSLIADLKKSNNTLSIQLAQVQGISPPPTMASPDNFCCKKDFVEDHDTTGHLEIDATPPVAAKKCRKRQGSVKNSPTPLLLSSGSDSEAFPSMRMSLKTIEEQNESSPRTPHKAGSPCKNLLQSASGKVVEIANEVLSNLTPHTRSAKRQVDKEGSKKKKKDVLEPLNLSSLLATDYSQNENAHPYSTRRSSRLKKK